jgi:hypothetical protein
MKKPFRLKIGPGIQKLDASMIEDAHIEAQQMVNAFGQPGVLTDEGGTVLAEPFVPPAKPVAFAFKGGKRVLEAA